MRGAGTKKVAREALWSFPRLRSRSGIRGDGDIHLGPEARRRGMSPGVSCGRALSQAG